MLPRDPQPLGSEGAAWAALQEVFSACQDLAMQRSLSAGSKAREEAEMPPSCSPTKVPPSGRRRKQLWGEWMAQQACLQRGRAQNREEQE